MGTTLDNGTYLPDEGERNCYEGLAGNWVALDNHLGSTDIHVTINDKQAWNGHIADTTIHVTSADKQAWNGHIADSVKHVTAEDKQAWNGKADNSALTAHTGNTTIHVTAEDKAKWDAVTSKADDSDVVHKSGDETISGTKTFTDNNMIKTSSPKVLLINTSQTGNTPPSSNTASFFRFDGGTVNNFGGLQCEFLTTGENRLTNYVKDITTAKLNSIQQRANSTTAMTVFNADLIIPSTDGITALGSSSKRWKDVQTYKVNALEPSSLSLPAYSSSRIDISSYITDLTGGNNNYIAPSNGYIFVRTTNGTYLKLVEYPSGVVSSVCSQTADDIGTFIPVLAGRTCIIVIKCSSIDRAYFIPCLGNV